MTGENTSPQLFVPVTPWHGAERLILDVPERQVLISFERESMEEHQILLCSRSGRRWMVGAGSLITEPPTGVTLMASRGPRDFPLTHHPLFAEGVAVTDQMSNLELQARALAEVVGVPVFAAATADPAVCYFFSDPSESLFGTVALRDTTRPTVRFAARRVSKQGCGAANATTSTTQRA